MKIFKLIAVLTILLPPCFNSAEAQTSLIDRITNVTRSLPKEIMPQRDPRLKVVRQGLFAGSSIFEVASPDKKLVAGTIDGALYTRPIDGEDKKTIVKPIGNKKWDVEGAIWSPNGKLIALKLIDETGVPLIPLINYTGKHEEITMKPYSRVGKKLPIHQLYIIEVISGKSTKIQHGDKDPYFHIKGWNTTGDALYFLRSDRLTRRLDLLMANAGTGKTTLVFTETNKYGAHWWPMLHGFDARMTNANLVYMLENGSFIWTSERTGFAQLYLYDRNAKLIRTLTERKNAGFVQRLVEVDEKRGNVYAITQGADENDVYKQTLYRFNLSGGQAEKLTDASELRVNFSNEMEKLLVLRKSPPDLYQVELMNNDGSDQKVFWKADISFLKELGYSPEFINVTAADGKTKLRSVIFKPKDFNPEKPYPVLEQIYGGPNKNTISPSFTSGEFISSMELANRGFIVVMTEGRGSPGRGQEFQNYTAGRFGQVEIADHAAVLRQLAKERSYMDLSRVGIFGHSWGGYFTLRALLQEPDLYKAGAMSSGATDVSSMRVSAESFMGCLPADCPTAYKSGDNLSQIDKLKAPLLIIHGTVDDDVPIGESFKLVDALQQAGKDYEFIPLSGLSHNVFVTPLADQKIAEFFEKQFIRTSK